MLAERVYYIFKFLCCRFEIPLQIGTLFFCMRSIMLTYIFPGKKCFATYLTRKSFSAVSQLMIFQINFSFEPFTTNITFKRCISLMNNKMTLKNKEISQIFDFCRNNIFILHLTRKDHDILCHMYRIRIAGFVYCATINALAKHCHLHRFFDKFDKLIPFDWNGIF